jgi:subtilase family serine protease
MLAAAAISTNAAAAAPDASSRGHHGYVEVPNSTYVLQDGEIDLGRFPDDPVRFEGALQVHNTQGAQALAYAVSDPSNRAYGNFLSPAQYRRRFAPTDAEANTITSWLRGAGLDITYNPSNHLMIAAQGKVIEADRAFKTDLHRIQAADGSVFTAPLTPLFVPRNTVDIVDGFVEGINTLSRLLQPQNHRGGSDDQGNDNERHSAHTSADFTPATSSAPPDAGFANATPCSAYWAEKIDADTPPLTPDYATPLPYAPCGYKPAQLQGAYGVTDLLQNGINGHGVTVAITDAYASPTIVQDINTYAANNGGAPWGNKFRQVVPSSLRYGYDDQTHGDLCGEQGWYGEETLDVEAVHTMAPGAKVLYVGASSCFDNDLLGALNDIVDQHQADIISNSWGGINEVIDPVLLDVYNAVFVQAAIEGIGVFFSSGDSGDEIKDLNGDGTRQVDLPASDPWVTAVGGTSLAVGQQNDYLFEAGWGTTSDTITSPTTWSAPLPGAYRYGAGGGTSQLFGQPAYQEGVVPDSISKYFGGPAGRAVPDIAADADPSTGMLVGITQTFSDGVRYGEYRIGGTSLASPLMAGIEALADQAAGHPHGFANPAIYDLRSRAFHDIVTPSSTLGVIRADFANGENDIDGLLFSLRSINQTGTIFTRPAYDDVTGLGTPNGAAYVTRLGNNH